MLTVPVKDYLYAIDSIVRLEVAKVLLPEATRALAERINTAIFDMTIQRTVYSLGGITKERVKQFTKSKIKISEETIYFE